MLPELVESTRGPVVGDRNYWSAGKREELARGMGFALLAPYRTKKRDRTPRKERVLEPLALPNRHRL